MPTILITDDSRFMRDNLKNILLEAGHKVVGEAANGKESVELYQKLHPDLVTMDITMPVLSGLDALKQIVALDPKANVVMVTAIGKPEKVLEALNAGAKNYITKPFEKEKVLEIIDELLLPV